MVHSGLLLPRLPCWAPGRRTRCPLFPPQGFVHVHLQTALLWTPRTLDFIQTLSPREPFPSQGGGLKRGGSGCGRGLLCLLSASAQRQSRLGGPQHDGTATVPACSPDSLSAPRHLTPPALPCLHSYCLAPLVLRFPFPHGRSDQHTLAPWKTPPKPSNKPVVRHLTCPETCPFSTGHSREFSLTPLDPPGILSPHISRPPQVFPV